MVSDENNSVQFGNDLTSEEESSIGEGGLDSSGALDSRWAGEFASASFTASFTVACHSECVATVQRRKGLSAAAAGCSVPSMLRAFRRPCFGHSLATRLAVLPPDPDRYMLQVVVRLWPILSAT